jgi:hypothetical protein
LLRFTYQSNLHTKQTNHSLASSAPLAARFLQEGGVAALLALPSSSIFPGHWGVVMVILRLVAEEPALLQVRACLCVR